MTSTRSAIGLILMTLSVLPYIASFYAFMRDPAEVITGTTYLMLGMILDMIGAFLLVVAMRERRKGP